MARSDTEEARLQFQLDAITNHTRALVPPERLRHTEDLVRELGASGMEQRILATGAIAPSFALKSAAGKLIRLQDLLALGPVVLKFFRGRWDPYDITELEALEALQPEVRAHRAVLVALSPQTVRQNAFTAEQHRLSFPLLSDPQCGVAADYGLTYTLPPAAQVQFRSMLINLPFVNGDDSWRLPLPATFVLGHQGGIVYAKAFADHRRRPEPQEILAALPGLRREDLA